jgi:adenylate kinase
LTGDARGLDKVVAIDVPAAELLRRLGGRYTCRQCQAPHAVAVGAKAPACQQCGGELYQRADDAPEAVQRRIQVYEQETVPVLEFYRQRGLLAEVSGVGTVEEVNRGLLAALGHCP